MAGSGGCQTPRLTSLQQLLGFGSEIKEGHPNLGRTDPAWDPKVLSNYPGQMRPTESCKSKTRACVGVGRQCWGKAGGMLGRKLWPDPPPLRLPRATRVTHQDTPLLTLGADLSGLPGSRPAVSRVSGIVWHEWGTAHRCWTRLGDPGETWWP